MNLLEIRDLIVQIEDTQILNGINLTLEAGQSYIMFGPNGSGKSTLLNAIMGLPKYKVVSGQIFFRGKEITHESVDERSKAGISMGFQHPPGLRGVKLSDVLKVCLGQDVTYAFSEDEKELIDAFRLTTFLERDINVDFSGGEKKRAEVLQMLLLKPHLLLLDEPDSGVDVESLKLITSALQRYIEDSESTALIVTHKGDILEFIQSNAACVLLDGKIHCFVNPEKVYDTIKNKGYLECLTCDLRVKDGW